MKDRRLWAFVLVLSLLPPVLVLAQNERQQAPAPAPTAVRAAVVLEGREIPVPVTIAPGGPVFGLSQLADALGGKLSSDTAGESITLRLADKDVVLGPGNAIVTVGDNIVSLSQPPTAGEGGVQVPVDFLKKTFGDVLGYSFEWRPEISRLVIARLGNRQMSVSADVVHLQGMTTVVLQFPEEPRYRINREQPGLIAVEMLADRLTPPPAKPVQDPLVQGIAIDPAGIRIQLAQGAQAESYVLGNPFRLVFDVHPTSTVEVAPTPAPVERSGIQTIVIDPGHGGAESGAVGPSGVLEKDLTLQLARELMGKLARLGVQVVMTRGDDSTVGLDNRTAIANQNKADLFVSIHLNSSLGSGAHGTETYFLSPQATDSRAARAAADENGPAGAGAATSDSEQQDVDLILWDLAQSHHLAESQRFANMIQGELNVTLQLRDRGVKQAPFRVLMGAMMPAVLVELGFISNPDEEKKLQDAAYRDQLLDSLARAIAKYKASVEGKPAPDAAPAAGAPAATNPASPASPAPAAPQPGAAKPPARQGKPA